MITADHKVLNEDQSRVCIINMQWLCRTWRRNGFKVTHAKPDQVRKRREVLEHSYVQKKNPLSIYSDNSLEFNKACEELNWNHERSTETNGIAERAVRRVKEDTSSVLIQSGLQEGWLAEAMELYCSFRNVKDLSTDGQTTDERRFHSPFEGPIIPFGAEFYSIQCISSAQKSFLDYSLDTPPTQREVGLVIY